MRRRSLRVVQETVLDAPTLSLLQELVDYWRRKCPPGGLPRRADIDPTEIPHLLPHLCITEPIEGGADYVIRLVGTAITTRYNYDPTGERGSALLSPDNLAEMCALYRRVIETRAPATMVGRYTSTGREHVIVERVVMPILGRDGVTPWLLFGIGFRN